MTEFPIDHLDLDRLLRDWRWLCPLPVRLVARNAFGDLFLENEQGHVLWLEVAFGKLTELADSVSHFHDLLSVERNRQIWLAEADARAAAQRGLTPSQDQCIGFTTPLTFAESGNPANPYIADLYDHVGFLGDLHRQISELPDGTRVNLSFTPPKSI